jgi:hypothetical protein
MTHEFWRETETGEVWAVELEDGVVRRCCGPLHWSEITLSWLKAGYDYRPEGARDLELRRADFEPLDEVTVTMIAGSVD